MKINQIINEGLVFYAKNPDGTKTYSLVKDAEHLANLEQKYRGAQVQKLDFARQDVQDWLDSRGVNLRRFPPGMETTVGPNQGRPADEPTQPQNVVWRAPGYKPGKGSPFDTSGSTLVKRTNFPAKDDVMAEGDGDHQIRPGMKVSQGTVVKVDGNTVTVKTSNGDLMTMNIHDVQQGMAEGMVKGEYGRVLDALQLYYPRLSMDELNVPGYHKVVADKANVPVEYAAQVINDFTRDNDPDEDEFDDDEQGVAEGIEGEIAGGAIGGLVGAAAGSTLGPIGGAIGGALGSSAGGAIGSRYQDGKPLKEKQQLDEIAPLLAIGVRLFMAAAPKIAQVIGKTGRAGAQGAGQVAKSGAEIAAKNAGQIGLGAGIYEIGSSVANIAKDITAKVGTAVDEKTVVELATLAFKYAIPAGIVLAVLYGGKKAIDSLFSDDKQKPGVAEGINDEDYGPELDALKKEFSKFTTHYDRMDQDSAYAAQWRKQNTDRLNQQGPDDEDIMGNIGDEMGQDDEDIMRETKPREKEADYGDDYQDMVSRVKKLAGLGPLKTVYDPAKRVYKNVPTAVQPKKEQR